MKLCRKVKRLQWEVRQLQEKKKTTTPPLQKALAELSSVLSTRGQAIIQSQIDNYDKTPNRVRWRPEMKMLAVQLKTYSTKAYRLLKSIFKLPTVQTVRQTLRDVDIYEGFHSSVLERLKRMALTMSEREKLVVVAFDEMSLNAKLNYDAHRDEVEGLDRTGDGTDVAAASHAGVFMVRGLTSNFKQPFGYTCSAGVMKADRLATVLKEALCAIRATGLKPVALVLDQGTNNAKAIKQLGLVDGKICYNGTDEVFIFWDTPHLIKNVRNNFRHNGFEDHNGAQVSWSHIEQLQAKNETSALKLCPRLTNAHINLGPFKDMKVKTAAQVQIIISTKLCQPYYLPLSFIHQLTMESCSRSTGVVSLGGFSNPSASG